MSYQIYKVIHLLGVLMVYLSVGGVTTHVISNGNALYSWKKGAAITHGIGMLISLIGGFGLLARLGFVNGLPMWALAKLGIWSIFAVSTSFLMRKPQFGKKFWWTAVSLGALAAFLAVYKPI